jgi:hypothetical protein
MALGLLAATPAKAQEDWSTSFTFYLWAAETDTTITTPLGSIDTTLSFSDALENLDFAFMGVVEASKGRWTLLGDFAQTNLSFSKSTPGPAFDGIDADIKLQVLNAYALYEVSNDSTWTFDLGAGVRWFNTDSTLALLGAAGRTARFNDSWFDPVIAGRLSFDITEKWSGVAFFDYGGFRSGSESWQIALTARYAFSEQWSLVAGYRLLDLKHGPSDDEFKFSQSGPVIGVRYDF